MFTYVDANIQLVAEPYQASRNMCFRLLEMGPKNPNSLLHVNYSTEILVDI